MFTNRQTRRDFLFSSLGLAVSTFTHHRAGLPLTAGQIIDRIKANVGIPWRSQTVDNIIAGSENTQVKGIATTMMATLDVVQRAAASGKNMIITHESTFFSHQDRTDQIIEDPTYLFKRDFLDQHNMIVFHFHDHWHRRSPDGIAIGMTRELGWEKHASPDNPKVFSFPGIPLGRFASDIRRKLKIGTVRVVGDPSLEIRKAVASWGNCSLFPGIPLISQNDVDVLIIGETNEWELVEYVQDTISSGKKKALIILGHVVSEQPGMKYCAEWLKGFISEVPVEFIPAPEPYWNPDNPGKKVQSIK